METALKLHDTEQPVDEIMADLGRSARDAARTLALAPTGAKNDALAAMAGGLGMAPGANIGDGYAVFEATHGTAPKYAGLDKVNPGSLILSGAMMLDYLGWKEASSGIWEALQRTIKSGFVTYDLARQIEGAKEVSCSGFADKIIEQIGIE